MLLSTLTAGNRLLSILAGGCSSVININIFIDFFPLGMMKEKNVTLACSLSYFIKLGCLIVLFGTLEMGILLDPPKIYLKFSLGCYTFTVIC